MVPRVLSGVRVRIEAVWGPSLDPEESVSGKLPLL